MPPPYAILDFTFLKCDVKALDLKKNIRCFCKINYADMKYYTPISRLTKPWNFSLKLKWMIEDETKIFIEARNHDAFKKNHKIGNCEIDIKKLQFNFTHHLKIFLQPNNATLFVLITINHFPFLHDINYKNKLLDPNFKNNFVSINNVPPIDFRFYKKRIKYDQSMENIPPMFPLLGHLYIKIIKAEDLLRKDWFSKSDPYCLVEQGNNCLKTQSIRNSENPIWNYGMIFPLYDLFESLVINVMDEDRSSNDEVLGSIWLDLTAIKSPKTYEYFLRNPKSCNFINSKVTFFIDVHFSYLKLFSRCLYLKEEKFLKKDEQFYFGCIKLLAVRSKTASDVWLGIFNQNSYIFSWKSNTVSSIALGMSLVGVCLIEPIHIPLILFTYAFILWMINLFYKLFVDNNNDMDIISETIEQDENKHLIEVKMSLKNDFWQKTILNKITEEQDIGLEIDKKITDNETKGLLELIEKIQDQLNELKWKLESFLNASDKLLRMASFNDNLLTIFFLCLLLFLFILLHLTSIRLVVIVVVIRLFSKNNPYFPSDFFVNLISRYPNTKEIFIHKNAHQ